jgi:hypothetical protein
MQHQPIPKVTSNDVERIVRRDYSETQFDSVMAVLNGYDGECEWAEGAYHVCNLRP